MKINLKSSIIGVRGDFLSVAFLALLLIVAAFQVVKHFSSRHARRIMDLERDYYIQDFEEDE